MISYHRSYTNKVEQPFAVEGEPAGVFTLSNTIILSIVLYNTISSHNVHVQLHGIQGQ